MSALPRPDTIPPFNRESPEQNIPPTGGRYQLVPLGASTGLSSRPYVVEGLIHRGSTFLIYGAPQGGKSFLSLDMVLSVSAGIKWMGHGSNQGLTVYVASEGRDGIPARLTGWKAAHSETQPHAFELFPENFGLLDGDDVNHLILAVNERSRSAGIAAMLVVIDTLSSAIPGADENNQATMSDVMRNLRRIASETGAAVGLVHHVNKASSREPRGSSALFAGMDTCLLVSWRSGRRAMEVVKQRDGATGEKIPFTLAVQSFPNEAGETVSTCVPDLQSGTCAGGETQGTLSGATALLRLAVKLASGENIYRAVTSGSEIEVGLDKLKELAYADLYADAPSQEAKRKRLSRDLDKLETAGKVRLDGKNITIVGSPEMLASAINDPSAARASFAGQTDGQDTPL